MWALLNCGVPKKLDAAKPVYTAVHAWIDVLPDTVPSRTASRMSSAKHRRSYGFELSMYGADEVAPWLCARTNLFMSLVEGLDDIRSSTNPTGNPACGLTMCCVEHNGESGPVIIRYMADQSYRNSIGIRCGKPSGEKLSRKFVWAKV
jgi:hypothetical protein